MCLFSDTWMILIWFFLRLFFCFSRDSGGLLLWYFYRDLRNYCWILERLICYSCSIRSSQTLQSANIFLQIVGVKYYPRPHVQDITLTNILYTGFTFRESSIITLGASSFHRRPTSRTFVLIELWRWLRHRADRHKRCQFKLTRTTDRTKLKKKKQK